MILISGVLTVMVTDIITDTLIIDRDITMKTTISPNEIDPIR